MQILGFVMFYEIVIRISNYNCIVKMNMTYIYTRSKIINKSTVKHRRWPEGADNRPFAATYRCLNNDAFHKL